MFKLNGLQVKYGKKYIITILKTFYAETANPHQTFSCFVKDQYLGQVSSYFNRDRDFCFLVREPFYKFLSLPIDENMIRIEEIVEFSEIEGLIVNLPDMDYV